MVLERLYREAVEHVVEIQRVSVSTIQRKFRLGYGEANRIVEAMERNGVVSDFKLDGTRDVLVSSSDHVAWITIDGEFTESKMTMKKWSDCGIQFTGLNTEKWKEARMLLANLVSQNS